MVWMASFGEGIEMRIKKHGLLSIEELEPRMTPSTFYVSLTGSDNNPGSLSQPFATINHGASVLHPGDMLYIRAGTYAESLHAIPGGTSWTTPVTVAAYPGETVTLQPNAGSDSVLVFAAASEEFIIVQGLIIDATNVNLDAVKITYSSNAGASSHIRLQNDEIKNSHNGMGVLITNDPSTGNNTDYNEFINDKIHNNGSNSLEHGLYINSNHNLIDSCDIYNNTVYNNNLGAAGIDINWGTKTVVENNISFQNANGDYMDNGTGTVQEHNLLAKNPLFVTPAGNDFHLQAGSPAIDAGVTLTQVPVDFDGLKRPQGIAYCIGAYEFPVNSVVTTHLQIGAGSSTTAGSSFSFTVTAQDANNNTLTSYLGTVHFTSTDAAAILPANYAFTAADAGVHTFTGLILKTAGSQTITASDTITGSITGNASVTVNPATAKSLVVSGYPSSTKVSTPQSFTVTAKDAFGNTATGYTGTITFTSSDSLAVLPAKYTFV